VDTIPFSSLPCSTQFKKALLLLKISADKQSQLLGRVHRTRQGNLAVRVWVLPLGIRLSQASKLAIQDVLEPDAEFSEAEIFGEDESLYFEEEAVHPLELLDQAPRRFNSDVFYSQL
jgi:hypothetical protein